MKTELKDIIRWPDALLSFGFVGRNHCEYVDENRRTIGFELGDGLGFMVLVQEVDGSFV